MYQSLRYDPNAKESMLNSTASNLLDSGSSARPFSTSFSAQSTPAPVFHHTGSIQGLHNVHGSHNIPTMPTTLSSRNSGLGGVPSSGVHQPSGSLPAGRFTSNNLPAALSQLSHGGLHGHTGMTSRGGINIVGSHSFSSGMNGIGASVPGASPGSGAVNNRGAIPGVGVSPSIIGGAGPRITSSIGSIAGGAGVGGALGRTINAGSGLGVASLSGSRVNLGPNNGGVQGPGRPLSAMLQQASPQMVSLLGNNFSTTVGTVIQGQLPTGNGQLGAMGLASDGASNDGAAFDINDFPQLTTRPSSAGGSQGSLAALRKQGVPVNSIVQQSQEFSIQNEDFPALPGYKSDFTADLHQKEQQHENALALMHSQHFAMGRSAGFNVGGSYVSHRQQQQQQQSQHQAPAGTPTSSVPASFAAANSTELLHLHGAVPDLFQASHAPSSSYHPQAVGPHGTGNAQVVVSSLRSVVPTNPTSGLSSYEQLVHQYQHHHNPSQYRLGPHQQQLSAIGQSAREQGLKVMQGIQSPPDRFGLLGLLSVIRMSDLDLTTLALGTDLTTLGLNLNSRDNLYKTFASPWADGPTKGEPEFTLPTCYVQRDERLQPGYFTKFQTETLFYIFYSMPNDEAQLFAAYELCRKGWFYHKELKIWLTRISNMEPLVKTNTYERGSYRFFDPIAWEIDRKENFVLHYEMVEKRPELPQH